MANVSICLGLMTLLMLAWPPAMGQSKNEKKEPAHTAKLLFKVPVDVVIINAAVSDKNGNPVTDLTSGDFRVYEDEKPQNIQTFAMEAYGPAGSAEPEASGRTAQKGADSQPRLISFVIDDLTEERDKPDVAPMVVNAITKFIKDSMSANDQVAILSASRMVKVPFSDNKKYLLDELATIPQRLNKDDIERPFTDYEAWLLSEMQTESTTPNYLKVVRDMAFVPSANSSPQSRPPLRPPETNSAWTRVAAKRQYGNIEFRYHNLLNTLRLNIRALRHFEGRKAIVLLSHGFLVPPNTSTAYQMQEVIDLALHSGIALNTVSIRDVPTSISDDPFEITPLDEDWRAQEGPLTQMASDTGGLFSSKRNDLSKGLKEIMNRQAYVYVLTYNTPGPHVDGSYHKIRLEVTRPGLLLSYRKGYYTPKEQLVFENSRRADIIDALDAPGEMNEIPMTLAFSCSQTEDDNYIVSFTANVDIRKLRFQEEEARRRNMVSIILAAYDELDNFISGTDKSIEFRLLESSYRDLRTRGLSSKVQFTLPIGRYKIKVVVRETNQNKMGSIIRSVEIP